MQALPMALARQILAVHSTFHSRATTDAERNEIVADLLSELRFHDPDVSVWDLLPLFDRDDLRQECPRCGLLSGHRYPCVG